MKILALETTGKYGSASVIADDGIIHSASGDQEMNHLRGIIGLADEALCDAGISKNELTHVAASVGPGSFTGIRIGVTAARTLSQFLNIPCISVSSLEAMALEASLAASDAGCDTVAVIINARRHQVYAGAWKKRSDGSMEVLLEEKQYMIEEFLELLKDCDSVYFAGDGIDAYEDIISEYRSGASTLYAPPEIRYQNASTVAALAYARAKAGKVMSYDELMPEYMRLAEAEQKLKEGTLSDKICKISK